MSIFKKIFDEARNSNISWEDSEAKHFEYRFNMAIKWKKIFTKKQLSTLVPIYRLDPKNKKILQYFATRLDAAKWIQDEKLTIDHEFTICGNIEISIHCGIDVYGFKWKPLELESYTRRKGRINAKSKMVLAVYYSHGTRHKVYPSITEASKQLHIKMDTLKKYLNAEKGMYKNVCYRWYNTEPRTEYVESYRKAAYMWGVGPEKAKELVRKGESFNNITILLDETGQKNVEMGKEFAEKTKENQGDYTSKKIKIFNKMGYLIYTAYSIQDAAKYLGLSTSTISKALAGRVINRRFRFEEVTDEE